MPKSSDGFRVYPRGFLGKNVSPQSERTVNPYSDRTSLLRYSVDNTKKPMGSIIGNPHVEAIYASVIKNDIRFESPEYRTNALKVALEAFGTIDFFLWFTAQYSNPVAGSLHSDFLVDTLKFIQTGSRSMSLENWMALLVITDEGNSIGRIPEEAKEFFGIGIQNQIQPPKQNFLVVDVIQAWCSQSGGLLDLVGTLHILFGNP